MMIASRTKNIFFQKGYLLDVEHNNFSIIEITRSEHPYLPQRLLNNLT
jgi:hypothetical protein